MSVLIFIMWVGGPGVSPAPTSFAKDFDTPQACNDAKDSIAARLKGTPAVFVAECVPKGEVRT